MDRNLVLAVSLSLAVYLVWFGFVDKRVNPPQTRPAAEAQARRGAAAPAATEAPSDPAAVLAAAQAVELGEASAKVSARGAALVSYEYPDPLGTVQLVQDPTHGLFATFPDLEFRRDASVKTGAVFVAKRADGAVVRKEFIAGQGTVLPKVVVTVSNPTRGELAVGPWTLSVGPGLGTVPSEKKDNQKLSRAIALTPEGGGLKGRVEKLAAGEHPGPYRWIGIDNRYFLAALLPSAEHFEPARSAVPPSVTLTARPVTLKAGGSFTWEVPFYLGAKGHTWLSRYGVGLERAIDFGFFAQLGRAMLTTLEKLHRSTGNWGWSIILLTLGLQVILFPLTWKGLRAAAAMRKLQPELTRIQQKWADDPQRMNAETMELYKKGGANPLGGCLPMLLQMPVFVALFNALRNSWELHGTGWMLWIRDLSAKDPYYVLPVVMGGLMLLQSKLNPPAGDPSQQKVMMLMPVVFTAMFMNFPSGLVLYWLTNSLVSTVLQLALKDRLEAA